MSPIKTAVDEAVSFEQAMSKIKALTQVKNIRAGDIAKVNQEMSELQETIMHIGATTEFTNQEVAGAAQKYAMSGWSKDQIVGALPTTIDIATATGERDLIKVGDYLSDEMQALGLMKGTPQEISKNVQHYGDLMTYALTQSNNDLESFHQAMKYFAPVGTQLGMKPEEMVAAVMTQADAGIKGSMGGTSMRMASLRMFAPPKAALKALDEMGELSSDAQKGLAEAAAEWEKLGVSEDAGWLDRMKALKEASKTMSKSDFMAKLSKITGVNAVSGQSSLLADFEKFEARLDEMTNGTVNGWAKDTAGIMRDNVATQFNLLDSAVSALANTFGSLFLPAVSRGLSMLTNFANSMNTWVQEHQTAATVVGVLAAAIAGLTVAAAGAALGLAAFSFAASGFAVLKDAITGAAAAMRAFSLGSLLSPPILAAVAAALALAAAAYFVYQNWEKVAPIFSAIGETLSTAFNSAIAALSPALDNLMTAFGRLMPVFEILGAGILSSLMVVLNLVANIGATIISTFANAVATVMNLFGNLGNALASLLALDFSKAGEYLKQALVSAVEGAFNTIKSLVGGLFDTFANIFEPLKLFDNGVRAPSVGGSSGGGSFGSPQQVQAQNVELNAPQIQMPEPPKVEQLDTTAILQPIQDVAAQFPATIQPVTDTMAQFPATMQPLQEGMAQVGTSTQMFNAEMTNSVAANTANNAAIQQATAAETANVAALQQTQAGLAGFNSALASTNGGLTSLSSSSSSAASAVSGLGSAASSAVAALNSAASQAASAASSVVAAASKSVPQNFRGGIYSKGAFLTTFAEKSPEAAIPIDNSQRAIDLWTKTGQMLGQLPGKNFAPEQPPRPQQMTTLEKLQRRRLEQVKAQYEAAKKAGALNHSTRIESPQANSTRIEYDKLGNIIGLNGLKDNVINGGDNLAVIREKKAAQLREWQAKNHSTRVESPRQIPKPYSTRIESLPTAPPFVPNQMPRSIFSGRVQTPNISDLPITQTQPRNYETGILPALTEKLSSGSDGIIPQFLNKLTQAQSESNSSIDLHLEVNIAGNATAEDVNQGIRQALPAVKDFAQELRNYQHEQQRRAF